MSRNHRCCHWRPRHALSPSNHVLSTIMNVPLRVPIFILLSCCINSSSLFPKAILCTLLHRENTSFEVWYLQSGLFRPSPLGNLLILSAFELPWLKYPTSRARWLSLLMNSRSPCVRPFLLPSQWFVTMLCMRPSPSSCCFASNFNALIRFPQRP